MLSYLKYEWLRKWKYFLAGTLLLFVVNMDLVNRVVHRESPNFVSVILIVLLWVLGAALVMDHIGRLYRSLFTDEGLLEMTLPLGGYKFLGARLLVVVLESVAVIGILGAVAYIDAVYLTDWQLLPLTWGDFMDGLQVVVFMLMAYLTLVLMVYLSLTLAKSIFAAIKYSKLIYIVSFILIAKGIARLISLFSMKFGLNSYKPEIFMPIPNISIIALVIIVLLFIVTGYLLDKKLNL